MKKHVWSALCVAAFLLLPQLAQAQGFLIPTDRRVAPLALKYHRVSVKIKDRAARTTVKQVFVNNTNRLLEAHFVFPLPPSATVSNFVMYINGKKTKGAVLVREKAARIYQSIVSRMKDPGLIEYMGGNLFRARIFPIPRKGEQKIELSFTQVIPYRSGMHRFVYPLKAGRGMKQTIQDFTMSVELNSKVPLKNVYSPTHKVSIARRGEKKAIVGFEKNNAQLNRDFVLYYSISQKDVGMNILSHRVKGKDGYFLMMLTPKTSYASKELPSKNITFVIDTSGSMAGAKMKWAKKALASCLNKLNPTDHFNVIRFSTDVEALHRTGLKKANKGNIAQAVKFVGKLEAAGGTAIDEATALALKQKPVGDGVSLIIFLTDGHPTIGETAPKAILKKARGNNKFKTRIFTFGIGTSINTRLLDSLAGQTKGTGDYVKPNKEIAQKINWFYDKVRYPVLSDLKLSVGKGIRLVDMYPKRLPDLYRGGQLLVFGRYRGKGHAAVTLSGKINGKTQKFVYETKFPEKSDQNEFIDRLWAHRKVAYLLDNIRLHGENSELKGEVVRLAKKFGIVTPYTSYLVVEEKDRWRLSSKSDGVRRPLIQTRRRRRIRRWFGRPGNAFGRGRLRSSGSTPPPATAQESAPAPKRRRPTLKLKATSGKDAVTTSKELKQLKSNSTISTRGGTRYVGNHLFVWKNGVWTDKQYKSSMKTLKIKYLSKSYFALLSVRSSLRKYLALGSRVILVIGKNKAIVIGTSGQKASKSAIQSFLK